MHKKIKFLLLGMLVCFGLCGNVKAEEYSETFQKLTKDGTIKVHAIENPIIVEKEQWGIQPASMVLQNILDQINLGDKSHWGWTCKSAKECEVSIYQSKEVNGHYTSEKIETHTVKIEYLDKKDETIVTKVKTVMGQMKPFEFLENAKENNYVLDDLNIINYYYSASRNNIGFVSKIMNYVPEVKELIKNQPITIDLTRGFGSTGEEIKIISISGSDAGIATIYYDGVVYGYMELVGTNTHNVIYIPSDTENTKEAYIEAIKKRVNNEDIEVTCTGKIPEESETVHVFVDGIDLTKTDGNYYELKIGDKTYPFVVMKKDELNESKYQQVEEKTGIQITTTDMSVPLDTVITVEEIKENTEIHNNIKKVLNVSTFKAFDISLYSETLKNNITTLKNGNFQVTIPLGKEYATKIMAAYYIHADGKIEKHDITMDSEGNATFETNHFSTYIITEKIAGLGEETSDPVQNVGEEIPDTFDGIMHYITLGILSILVLGVASYYKKRMN